MDNAPMTFTSLALIVLLLLMCFIFACHCLGPRAATWMRSNKEEKIGLSKNKLFHANGYMIHSGSEFLLSTSGSFKRFDTIDKDDHSNSNASSSVNHHHHHHHHQQQHQQSNQSQGNQQQTSGSTTTTTPLWNLPQADVNIPPQPLRPAPAPNSAGPSKTVTFSFNQINELDSPTFTSPSSSTTAAATGTGSGSAGTAASAMLPEHHQLQESPPRSCLRSPHKTAASTLPHAIGAPPPPRLTNSSSVTLSSTAIPRPIAKRQISLQNGIIREQQQQQFNTDGNESGSGGRGSVGELGSTGQLAERRHPPTLTRRNSSTNPFLCESVESLNISDNATNTALTTNNPNGINGMHPANVITPNGNNSNPFYIANSISSDSSSTTAQINPGNSFGNTRNRSFSETETSATDASETVAAAAAVLIAQNNKGGNGSAECSPPPDIKQFSSRLQATAGFLKMHTTTNPFTGLTQRVKGPHMLQKTISEDFLFRKLGVSSHMYHGIGNNNTIGNGNGNGNGTWSFGRSLLRQDSSGSLGRRNSSQLSLDSNMGSMDSINLERAISCDSVNSDCSVFQCDLDQPYTQITGYLCIGLHYDKNSITNESMELTVSVLEAKGLICPFNVESLDTFVRIYLVPDHAGAMQTKIFKNSPTPSYNESFNFWLKKQQGRHSLWFHLYHNGPAHTLIGEAEMEIGEMPRPITTWIPLSDSRKCNARWGELMFSLSYLPTAERLTIVIVKARNLKLDLTDAGEGDVLKQQSAAATVANATNPVSPTQTVQSVFVKIYIMNNEKKVLKKRTSLKRKDRCPIFNESMIFSVPPHSLTTVQLRLTVFGVVEGAILPLGHVIAGSCAVGKGLRHWHQMLSSLRKPVAMWHVLRRATNQPIFTGGAEAVVAAMQSTAALQRAKRNSII